MRPIGNRWSPAPVPGRRWRNRRVPRIGGERLRRSTKRPRRKTRAMPAATRIGQWRRRNQRPYEGYTAPPPAPPADDSDLGERARTQSPRFLLPRLTIWGGTARVDENVERVAGRRCQPRHRRARDELRKEYQQILADLDRYDRMQGYQNPSEFGAAALGQLGGMAFNGIVANPLAVRLGQMARYGHEMHIGGMRIAPFGNRRGHPTGRWPHYHRGRPDPSRPGIPSPVKGSGDIALGIDAKEIGRSLTGFETMKLIAVNDAGSNATIREPQDVQFFPSIEDAEREHEPWFSEEPYLAVDSDGARYVFVAADPDIQLKPMPDEAPDPSLYRKFAECTLKYYLQRRSHWSGSRNLKSFPSIISMPSFMRCLWIGDRKSD